MDFALLLTGVFLMVFLGLALLLMRALRVLNRKHDPDHHALFPQPNSAHTPWQHTLFKMLVMRPWPYKDLWTPLNRVYWPDEQAYNRQQRRHSRRHRTR